MIFGIGMDVVEIERMIKLLERYARRLPQRILSDVEQNEYRASHNQAVFLAKRFAAKEAFSKALGTGIRAPLSLSSVSVGHDALGKPILQFSPALAEFVAQQGIVKHHVSISDERRFAYALVILEQ